MTLQLKSADFSAGGNIPKQFTCEGADISPALEGNTPPASTQSFAFIADDPDAPVGRNLPQGIRVLVAELGTGRHLDDPTEPKPEQNALLDPGVYPPAGGRGGIRLRSPHRSLVQCVFELVERTQPVVAKVRAVARVKFIDFRLQVH